MKSVAILAIFLLGTAFSTSVTLDTGISEVKGLNELLELVAGEVKTLAKEYTKQGVNVQNLTDMVLQFSGGFMSGIFHRSNHPNAAKCFANVQLLSDIIKYVRDLMTHGFEKVPIRMVRQILVLGVMVLNFTIEEILYCSDVKYILTTIVATWQCFRRCPRQYDNYIAPKLLRNTYNYFLHLKESRVAFLGADYYNSGVWFSYVFYDQILVHSIQCDRETCPTYINE